MIVRQIEDELQIAVPAEAHDLAGFRKWASSRSFPENGSVALVQGKVLIDMSPERVDSHNQVKSEVNTVIGSLVKAAKLGRYYPDRALLTNDAAGLANEPDAAFASWESLRSRRLVRVVKRGKRGKVDGSELRGSPDWVLEIVSSSSVRKDTKLLIESYYRAEIPEYWIIDARFEPLQFTILVRGADRYEAIVPVNGWLASTVFQRQFRLERELDELGDWLYNLRLRELPKS
jgi:Uma2 family endonuclease